MKKNVKKEQKINTKKIILISIIIIAFIATTIFIILMVNSKENKKEFKIDGIEMTKNNDILKDVKVAELDITNQTLYRRGGESTFNAIIINNTGKDYYIKELYITFDKKKVLLARNTTLKSGDKKPIEVTFDSNMLNINKIEYEINN